MNQFVAHGHDLDFELIERCVLFEACYAIVAVIAREGDAGSVVVGFRIPEPIRIRSAIGVLESMRYASKPVTLPCSSKSGMVTQPRNVSWPVSL